MEGAAESIEHRDSDPVCLPESNPSPTLVLLFVVSKSFKVNTKHLFDSPEILSRHFISLPASADQPGAAVRMWEFLFSLLLSDAGLATFGKMSFFTALLWREHVRDKRFMWHSGILKMLITFYLHAEVKFRVL